MDVIIASILWFLLVANVKSELIVNVGRNRTFPEAGVVRQVVNGNSSTDTVLVEYEEADGTLITQLTDFRTQSQFVRVLIPGEEELLQPRYQALCFISSYTGDLIAPEAVMKLRQKHPKTVRIAEDDLGEIVQDSPLKLVPSSARLASISSHLSYLCRDARDSTFTSEHELFNIFSRKSAANKLNSFVQPEKGYENLQRCFSLPVISDKKTPCICSRQVWFNWFPCALKYCRNKDSDGEHRCGIKTCRKCMTYRYRAKSRHLCSWDEP